jgi:tRNA (guanine37-N1)-methyltransferase
MRIDVLTLFPGMFPEFLAESMVGIARRIGVLDVFLTDLRDFAFNKHRQTDDYPYGGGPGMVMKPEPAVAAVRSVKTEPDTPVIYFTPQGCPLTQQMVREFAHQPRLILLCGHYKELDQRARDIAVTDEISVGDYVLSGGELPAMILIDAVARLQEGVLSDSDSADSDSFEQGLLGCPHYTRPPDFEGWPVPRVLLSGNHAAIEQWRREQALDMTRRIRPDLLESKTE